MLPVKQGHERSEHWHTRHLQFRREAERIVAGRLVFLGNSLTEGFPLDYFFPDLHPLNRGISGDHVDGLLERLHDSVIRLKPAKLFIMIGINDINAGDSESVISDNYNQLMTELGAKLAETNVFVQSILPTSREWSNCPKEKISFINGIIRQEAGLFSFNWIDLHHHFKNEQGYIKEDLTDDGLHLNQAGYRQWAKILKPYL